MGNCFSSTHPEYYETKVARVHQKLAIQAEALPMKRHRSTSDHSQSQTSTLRSLERRRQHEQLEVDQLRRESRARRRRNSYTRDWHDSQGRGSGPIPVPPPPVDLEYVDTFDEAEGSGGNRKGKQPEIINISPGASGRLRPQSANPPKPEYTRSILSMNGGGPAVKQAGSSYKREPEGLLLQASNMGMSGGKQNFLGVQLPEPVLGGLYYKPSAREKHKRMEQVFANHWEGK